MSTQITSGSFTNVASTPFFLPLQQHVSFFKLTNASKLASYTSARITNVEWWDYMANGIAYVDAPTTITGPLNASAVIRTQLAQNGISVYDSSVYTQGATIAISSFTPGQPTVFTCGSAHGFQVGDNVRIVSLATAPQMGGLVMTVTAVGGGGTTFTTLFDSTNAVTSTGSVYKVGNVAVQNSALYYPQNRAIAKITLANPMVVTTLVQQNYAVGDVVRFLIPTQFGMQQLNSTTNGLPLEFTISAVNNAVGTQTVTFANTNSSAFTAFAWAAAASYPYGLPVMIPQGEGNLNNLIGITPAPLPYGNQNVLSFARQNTASRGLLIGAGDGTAAASTGGIIGSTTDTWYWEAHTSLQQFPQV
jgi:hypothetical protein